MRALLVLVLVCQVAIAAWLKWRLDAVEAQIEGARLAGDAAHAAAAFVGQTADSICAVTPECERDVETRWKK